MLEIDSPPESRAITWQPIESVPKNCYFVGTAPQLPYPFEVIWNICESSFVVFGDVNVAPVHWLPLPSMQSPDRLPIATAPKEGYCFGYDPHLKRPFVMGWSKARAKFLAVCGFGDETPTHWSPIPALPRADEPLPGADNENARK